MVNPFSLANSFRIDFKKITDQFVEIRKLNMGADEHGTATNVSQPNLFRILQLSLNDKRLIDAIMGGSHLSTLTFKHPYIDENSIGNLNLAITVHQILEFLHKHKLLEKQTADVPDRVHMGWTYENWNRALAVLSHFGGRENKENVSTGARAKGKRDAPSLPFMLSAHGGLGELGDAAAVDHQTVDNEASVESENDEDGSADDENDAEKKHRKLLLRTLNQIERVAEEDPEVYRQLSATSQQLGSANFLRSLTQLDQLVYRQTKKKGEHGIRAPISRERAIAFMKKLRDKTKILWGKEEIDAMHLQNLTPEERRKNRQHVMDTMGFNPDEEEVPDGLEGEATTEKALAAARWMVRAQMASVSAPIPGFLETCKAWGIDPEDLTIRGLDGQKFTHNYKFKPHQVCCE